MADPVDREAIQAAALTLFAERGYRSTTMEDIGAALGIRGPSLYKHVGSKQELLVDIMVGTMSQLIRDQLTARKSGGDIVLQVRRMVEGHVRFHAAQREQAHVGNREIDNLDDEHRQLVLALRSEYESGLRAAIVEGTNAGVFQVDSPRLASYSLLDMGMGVAMWFRQGGPHTVDEVAYTYADYAIKMLSR